MTQVKAWLMVVALGVLAIASLGAGARASQFLFGL